jgi:hypothetical protein
VVDGNRVLGLKLERLKSIPTVVGVACGKRKREAILGALRGQWINVLVTDQFTAESLVMTLFKPPKTMLTQGDLDRKSVEYQKPTGLVTADMQHSTNIYALS